MFVVAVAQWTEQHDFSMKGGDAKLPTNKAARAYKILHPPQAEGSSRESSIQLVLRVVFGLLLAMLLQSLAFWFLS
jgi:hypothetical protein